MRSSDCSLLIRWQVRRLALMSDPYQVIVVVHEARDIPGRGTSHTSDPSVRVELGPITRSHRTTTTKSGAVNAVWEQTFIFKDAFLNQRQFDVEKIAFKLQTQKLVSSDQLIGQAEVSVKHVFHRAGSSLVRTWVPLVDIKRPGQDAGFLLISVHVLTEGSVVPQLEEEARLTTSLILPPSIPQMEFYQLNVLIYRAEHLNTSISSRLASVNAFVSVRFNGNVQRTSSKNNRPDPIFNRLLQFPFSIPLMSDAIEVLIWNKQRARPDELLGSITFFQSTLTYTPRGPAWMNLYSKGKEDTGTGYVGRVLLRLSISPSKVRHPVMQSIALDPITDEPDSSTCFLKVYVRRVEEAPVSGGFLSVGLRWGPLYAETSKRLGKDGSFEWNEPLRLLSQTCPTVSDDIFNVELSLIHYTGLKSTVVSTICLPPKSLFSAVTNGDMSGSPSHPVWRPFSPGVGNGMLLSHVLFTRESLQNYPLNLPMPRSKPYSLKLYISHAVNIPSATDTCMSSPLVVASFGGATRATSIADQQRTLFPIWNEILPEMDVSLDAHEVTNLHLNVFHKTYSGYKLLARTDPIPIRLNEAPQMRKFQLYSADPGSNDSDCKLPGSCISIAFVFTEGFSDPSPVLSSDFYFEDDEVLQSIDSKYHVKLHIVGLRGLVPYDGFNISSPSVHLSMPVLKPDPKRERPYIVHMYDEVQTSAEYIPEGSLGSLNFSYHNTWKGVKVSQLLEDIVNFEIRVYDDRFTSPVLIGYAYIPFSQIKVQDVDRPQLTIEAIDEAVELSGDEKSPLLNSPTISLDDSYGLDLDIENANFSVELREPWAGPQIPVENIDTSSVILADAVPVETLLVNRTVTGFPLFRGRTLVETKSKQTNLMASNFHMGNAQIECGMLKAVFFAISSSLDKSGRFAIESNGIQKVMQANYLIRVYVYRGRNIVTNSQDSSYMPYIILNNGQGKEFEINDREGDEVDACNPGFYRLFEFESVFPENSILDVSVWERSRTDILPASSDRFIGTSRIDVEQQVLDKQALVGDVDEFPISQVLDYSLMTPTSLISQGVLEMRVDVLEWAQAQMYGPEAMVKPEREWYELRVIVWGTRDIKSHSGVDKGLNQLVSATANFDASGEDTVRSTDVAYKGEQSETFNWRMKFPVRLPCKVPRIKFSVWNYNYVYSNEVVGDAQKNLDAFFHQAYIERKSRLEGVREVLPLSHPDRPYDDLGKLTVEFMLVSEDEASRCPVGEGWDEPNQDPVLVKPTRNLASYLVGSRLLNSLDYWASKKFLLVGFLLLLVVSVLLIPYLITALQDAWGT